MQTTNKYIIEIASWKRKQHYGLFKNFEQPFWGICVEINCTQAYNYCKAYGISFFLFYLHKSLQAANHFKEFRYRIEKDELIEYERIDGSITVLRKDETFGFAYFDYKADLKGFINETGTVIKEEKIKSGLQPRYDLNNLIHFSVLKTIKFTSYQHAQNLTIGDSTPKITFGKLSFQSTQVLLPVAIHVHHALCDGYHLGNYIEYFQKQMELNY